MRLGVVGLLFATNDLGQIDKVAVVAATQLGQSDRLRALAILATISVQRQSQLRWLQGRMSIVPWVPQTTNCRRRPPSTSTTALRMVAVAISYSNTAS